MNEDGMWEGLRPVLQGLGLDPHRIENGVCVGMPDVNYTRGFIELKYLDAWPMRVTTPVRFPKLEQRPQQVAWMTQRWLSGGPVYLMVRVYRQLMMFTGPDSRLVRQGLCRSDLRWQSVWETAPDGRIDDARRRSLMAWLTWDDKLMTEPERARFYRLRCGGDRQEVADAMEVLPEQLDQAERAYCRLTSDLIEYWVC